MKSATERNESGKLAREWQEYDMVVKYGGEEKSSPREWYFYKYLKKLLLQIMQILGKAVFFAKEHRVQRLWGENVSGMFKDPKEDSTTVQP